MKKIITALMNEEINNKLKKEKIFQIEYDDIQYQEALFEILEKNKNIDFIVLSETLPGNYKFIDLIKKIKELNINIEIIVFLEKENEELKTQLLINGVNKIFIDRSITVKELINIINTDFNDENKKIKEELEELKKIVLENKKTYEKKEINLKKLKEDIIKKILKEKTEKSKRQTKIVSIAGTYGVGKSVFSSFISDNLSKNGIKTLLIDFDILNNSINTIFGKKRYPKKFNNDIESLIKKINKNLDILCGIDLIFNKNNVIDKSKLKELINKVKNKYELIIIDTSSECFFKYTKLILEESEIILYLIEPNLIEIKKSKNLLKIYTEEWKIEKNKFGIIINKYNNLSINYEIIEKIFSDYKILGKIKYDKTYNLFVNKNMKNIIFKRKSEYKKIIDKI